MDSGYNVIAIEQVAGLEESPGAKARRRFVACEGRPLLLADWERALFMHFEVPAEVLQRHVHSSSICMRAGRS